MKKSKVEPVPSEKYKKFNHWHNLKDDQGLIDLGTGTFVADNQRVALLKALNECGLATRSHCYGHETGHSFVAISMENIKAIEIRDTPTEASGRKFPKGSREVVISWKRTD